MIRVDEPIMLRLVVNLLLQPCLLMTPLSGLAHSHEALETGGHTPRPHFHASVLTSRESRAHWHQHPHHHHGGSFIHCHTRSIVAAKHVHLTLRLPASPAGHDADAVFVSAVEALVAKRSRVTVEFAPPPIFVSTALRAVSGGFNFSFSSAHDRSPKLCDSCPLYLRHLALLI